MASRWVMRSVLRGSGKTQPIQFWPTARCTVANPPPRLAPTRGQSRRHSRALAGSPANGVDQASCSPLRWAVPFVMGWKAPPRVSVKPVSVTPIFLQKRRFIGRCAFATGQRMTGCGTTFTLPPGEVQRARQVQLTVPRRQVQPGTTLAAFSRDRFLGGTMLAMIERHPLCPFVPTRHRLCRGTSEPPLPALPALSSGMV